MYTHMGAHVHIVTYTLHMPITKHMYNMHIHMPTNSHTCSWHICCCYDLKGKRIKLLFVFS